MSDTPAVQFTVQCLQADRCTVFFEPEGAHVDLAREDVIQVTISGGTGAAVPEIAYVPEGLVVGAWAQADTAVADSDGNRIAV